MIIFFHLYIIYYYRGGLCLVQKHISTNQIYTVSFHWRETGLVIFKQMTFWTNAGEFRSGSDTSRIVMLVIIPVRQ